MESGRSFAAHAAQEALMKGPTLLRKSFGISFARRVIEGAFQRALSSSSTASSGNPSNSAAFRSIQAPPGRRATSSRSRHVSSAHCRRSSGKRSSEYPWLEGRRGIQISYTPFGAYPNSTGFLARVRKRDLCFFANVNESPEKTRTRSEQTHKHCLREAGVVSSNLATPTKVQ